MAKKNKKKIKQQPKPPKNVELDEESSNETNDQNSDDGAQMNEIGENAQNSSDAHSDDSDEPIAGYSEQMLVEMEVSENGLTIEDAPSAHNVDVVSDIAQIETKSGKDIQCKTVTSKEKK